jgi:hypothetical protein
MLKTIKTVKTVRNEITKISASPTDLLPGARGGGELIDYNYPMVGILHPAVLLSPKSS